MHDGENVIGIQSLAYFGIKVPSGAIEFLGIEITAFGSIIQSKQNAKQFNFVVCQ